MEISRNPHCAVGCDGEGFHTAFEWNLLKMSVTQTGKPVRHIESKPQITHSILNYRRNLRCKRARNMKGCGLTVL